MATAKERAGSNRTHELELIVDELEELNEEVRANDIWIRTRRNLPNQKSWHLGTSDQPSPSAHSLTVEYPSPQPHVWRWGDIEPYLLKLAELCPLELTERQSVLLTNPAFGLTGVKVTNTMRIAISIDHPHRPAHGFHGRAALLRDLHGILGARRLAGCQGGEADKGGETDPGYSGWQSDG